MRRAGRAERSIEGGCLSIISGTKHPSRRSISGDGGGQGEGPPTQLFNAHADRRNRLPRDVEMALLFNRPPAHHGQPGLTVIAVRAPPTSLLTFVLGLSLQLRGAAACLRWSEGVFFIVLRELPVHPQLLPEPSVLADGRRRPALGGAQRGLGQPLPLL